MTDEPKCKESTATICVDIYVTCPECERTFNLLNGNYDDSEIMHEAFPDDHWGNENANYEIICPQCAKAFIIKEFVW